MKENVFSRGIAWVTTYSGVEAEEVARAREELLKEGKVAFNVCCLDYVSDFYLLGDSTKFILATELNIPITLVQYDEDDFIHISMLGFTSAQFPGLIDEDGNVRVGDFFDNYMWNGDSYKIEADLIIGEAVYTLTAKEQDMKRQTPFESGVAVHKAYKELGMTEDSDIKEYINYYIKKQTEKQS